MEFQEIFTSRANAFGGIWIALIIAAFILFMVGVMELFESKEGKADASKTRGIIALFCTVTLVGIGFIVLSSRADVESNNEKSLVTNVQTKYDVDEVILHGIDVSVDAEQEDAQNVIVKVDDKTYTFHLTQDRETWEPTLTNPPVPGGSSDTTNLSAEDLLKQS